MRVAKHKCFKFSKFRSGWPFKNRVNTANFNVSLLNTIHIFAYGVFYTHVVIKTKSAHFYLSARDHITLTGDNLKYRIGLTIEHNQILCIESGIHFLKQAEKLFVSTCTIEIFLRCNGGEGGIRTLEGLSPLPVFKTGAFNRSATSPHYKTLGFACS